MELEVAGRGSEGMRVWLINGGGTSNKSIGIRFAGISNIVPKHILSMPSRLLRTVLDCSGNDFLGLEAVSNVPHALHPLHTCSHT